MSVQEQIIDFLRQKYNPIAILLHGSRAVGKARPHSDWDILMLFDGPVPRKGYREEIAGSDVEWKAYMLPILSESIVDVFDVYLQFAVVLWERNGEGSDLLNRAKAEYAKGPKPYTEDETSREKQYFAHKVLGLEDDKETQYLFFRHQCVLRTLALRLWFEFRNKKFSQPLYLSMPLIQKEDPEFYNHLVSFTAQDTTSDQKIGDAKWMFSRLFEE